MAKKSDAEVLATLAVLMDEQESAAVLRAKADPRRVSATWIAMEDSLILLVVTVTGAQVKKKKFLCSRVAVHESEDM